MTAEEFQAAGVELYGRRWKAPMSRALGIDDVTVWRYVTAATPIPGPVAAAVRCFLIVKRGGGGGTCG